MLAVSDPAMLFEKDIWQNNLQKQSDTAWQLQKNDTMSQFAIKVN